MGIFPEDIPLSDANDTVKFFLETGMQKPSSNFSVPEIIKDGTRNDTIFKFACMMQAKGVSDQAVYAATKAENEAKCVPPLSEDELGKDYKKCINVRKRKTYLYSI